MKKPEISVRIITYNHEKWIRQCIESVLAQQTTFDFEIIVGDDCSTDKTYAILEEYQRESPVKFQIISSEKNVGKFQNSKRTLSACQGKYIAFLEGDDYWHDSNKLEIQREFMQKNNGYGMVYSECHKHYENKNQITKSHDKKTLTSQNSGYIYEDLLKANFISTASVLIEKKFIDLYDDYDLYMNQHFLMADYPRWLEISRHTKIGHIKKALATYRVLEESASHSRRFEKNLEFLESIQRVRTYYIDKYGCTSQTRKAVSENYYKRRLILASFASKPGIANDSHQHLIEFQPGLDQRIKYGAYKLGARFRPLALLLRLFYQH
jgi:glycosyltransferase involved in cell wall biosynthesis